jgi:hypothetical protein
MKFTKRVLKDIKNRHHIEVYALSFASFAVAFVSLFAEQINQDLINSLMLGAIGLLILNISTPQVNNHHTLDHYLDDRTNLGPLAERLKGAKKLYIYAPSAANILNSDRLEAIRNEILSKKDGELRVIIQNPNKTEALNILIHQLDHSVDFQLQSLTEEIARTLNQFKLINRWNNPGDSQFKLLDYGPGFSLVLIDPDRNSGQIIVELHGFHNESTRSRMHIVIDKQASERWFTYWYSQFEYMWADAEDLPEDDINITYASSSNGSA